MDFKNNINNIVFDIKETQESSERLRRDDILKLLIRNTMKIPQIICHELISTGDLKKQDETTVVRIHNAFTQFLNLKGVRQHCKEFQHGVTSSDELETIFLEFCSFSCPKSFFNKIVVSYPKLKNIVLHRSNYDYESKEDFIKFSKSNPIITVHLRFLNKIIEKSIEFRRTSAYITEVIKFTE